MDSLPDLALLNILTYLEFKDLSNISCVCFRLNKLSSNDFIWKNQCKKVWVIDSIDDYDVITWKDAFVLLYKKFGKYLDCYKAVKLSWNSLEKYLSAHCPEIFASLNPGIDENILTEFESKRQIVLPPDYKLSYMIHNGQKCDLPLQFGICGGLFLPHENFCTSALCSFETAIKSFSHQCHYSLPVTIGQSIKLSISQLVLPIDRSNKLVSHNTEIIGFRHGQYCSISSSFTNWFSDYVEKLSNDHYIIYQGHILLYDKDTEVSETTKYITVKVRWSYWYSTTNLYTYHITMSMAEDAPVSESCKLASRYWEINDATGHSYVVDGDGVVGYYPIMKPGSSFSWRSYTNFQSKEGGSMEGHFTMHYLSNPGLLLNVACPKFIMKHPPLKLPSWTESRHYPLQQLS